MDAGGNEKNPQSIMTFPPVWYKTSIENGEIHASDWMKMTHVKLK